MIHVLVDYLVLSCPRSEISVETVFEKLRIKETDCLKSRSYYGLDYAYYLAGMKLHVSEKLLILDLSGKGCRALETLYGNGLDWIDFIEFFLRHEYSHLARLDIAADDKCEIGEKPILNMDTMFRKAKEKAYICKSRKVFWTQGSEEALYFGAASSDRRLRIYNKAMERKVDYPWIRAEFQLRNDAALSFYMRALERNSIGETMGGMLYDFLRFTTKSNKQDDHQSRLIVCRWWQKFCGTTEKIPGFYIGGMEYNEDSLRRYLGTQVSSSMRTYVALHDGDLTGLIEMVAAAKLNKKQKQLLKEHELRLATIALERKAEVYEIPDLFAFSAERGDEKLLPPGQAGGDVPRRDEYGIVDGLCLGKQDIPKKITGASARGKSDL